jgi:hypothetical protein
MGKCFGFACSALPFPPSPPPLPLPPPLSPTGPGPRHTPVPAPSSDSLTPTLSASRGPIAGPTLTFASIADTDTYRPRDGVSATNPPFPPPLSILDLTCRICRVSKTAACRVDSFITAYCGECGDLKKKKVELAGRLHEGPLMSVKRLISKWTYLILCTRTRSESAFGRSPHRAAGAKSQMCMVGALLPHLVHDLMGDCSTADLRHRILAVFQP